MTKTGTAQTDIVQERAPNQTTPTTPRRRASASGSDMGESVQQQQSQHYIRNAENRAVNSAPRPPSMNLYAFAIATQGVNHYPRSAFNTCPRVLHLPRHSKQLLSRFGLAMVYNTLHLLTTSTVKALSRSPLPDHEALAIPPLLHYTAALTSNRSLRGLKYYYQEGQMR